MKIIIYDTEYTSWEGSLVRNWNGPNEHKEIVKLSAIKINIDKDIGIDDIFDVTCKPQINPILSDYFVNLTNITNSEVTENGITCNEALEKFLNFCKEENKLLNCYSYGNNTGNDCVVLIENINLYNIRNKVLELWLKTQHFDICDIFSKYVDTKQYSSGTIYKAFNIDVSKEDIKVHDSSWDVKSQYLVLRHIYNYFPKTETLKILNNLKE